MNSTADLIKPIIDSVLDGSNGTLTHDLAQNLIIRNVELSKNIVYHIGRGELYIKKNLELPYGLSLKRGILSKAFGADNSMNDIYSWFNRMGFVKALPTKIIDETLLQASAMNAPVTFFDDMLEEVKQNGSYNPDIYKRVMVDWLGAKDEAYTYAWLKLLMVDIYKNQTFNGQARDYNPAPHMFVTQSEQGVGKGLFMAGISGGNNVTYKPTIKEDDLAIFMARYLLIDMDDLAASGEKNSVDTLKQRVTQKTIRLRQLFTQSIIENPNRAVWVGSTNRLNIFSDTTGDRRSFPINLGTDRTRATANIIGQQRYKEFYSQQLFLDLWRTFLVDFEDNKIPTDFEYGTDVDESRIKYVQGFTIASEIETVLDDILNKQVPDTILKNNQMDITAYLTDGETTRGNRENVAGAKFDKMISFKDLELIPQQVLHKSLKLLVPRARRQTVVEMMRERGFKEVNRDLRYYKKI